MNSEIQLQGKTSKPKLRFTRMCMRIVITIKVDYIAVCWLSMHILCEFESQIMKPHLFCFEAMLHCACINVVSFIHGFW